MEDAIEVYSMAYLWLGIFVGVIGTLIAQFLSREDNNVQ